MRYLFQKPKVLKTSYLCSSTSSESRSDCNTAFLITDTNGRFEQVSPAFEVLTGYSSHCFYGMLPDETWDLLKLSCKLPTVDFVTGSEAHSVVGFLFTRECEPREVAISISILKTEHGFTKRFCFKEKTRSRIDKVLQFANNLLKDNQTAMAIYNNEGLVLKANQKYYEFGDTAYTTKETFVGKTIDQLYDGDKEKDFYKALFQVIHSGKPYYVTELMLKHPTEGLSYWDVSLVPIYVADEIKYVVDTSVNVTEKVHNQRLLEEQNQQLEALIENMSDAMAVFDEHGRITKVNKVCRDFFRIAQCNSNQLEELLDQVELYLEDGSRILKNDPLIAKVLHGQRLLKFRVDMKINGQLVNTEINCSPLLDKQEQYGGSVVLIKDITEHFKNIEARLLQSQHSFFNDIIENLAVGYTRLSFPDFKLIYMNSLDYEILTHVNPKVAPVASILGSDILELYQESSDEREAIRILSENISLGKCNNFLVNKRVLMGGTERYFKVIYHPLYGINNQIVELVNFTMDITDEIVTRNKLEESLKLKEEIFINISHELKTPINVIFSTQQLLNLYLRATTLEENRSKFASSVDIIRQNCYRCIKLINNIVDISKIEAGFFQLNLSNVNIVQITEDIIQSVVEYVNSKKLEIIFDTNTEEKMICCDPEKIERIILNLISNAIKFSSEKGKIHIKLTATKNTIKLIVKDTGIGIESEQQDQIFKRFYQVDKSLARNAEGTGIGLTLTKSIVELHGGSIHVKSKVGHGSTFTIELPARTLSEPAPLNENRILPSKIEMINIEFSDIYRV